MDRASAGGTKVTAVAGTFAAFVLLPGLRHAPQMHAIGAVFPSASDAAGAHLELGALVPAVRLAGAGPAADRGRGDASRLVAIEVDEHRLPHVRRIIERYAGEVIVVLPPRTPLESDAAGAGVMAAR